ncbi:hypothetical protein A3Q56_02268 [Intoshia linei]|uniref:Uncharacterized protein n=1 Tax=Intoshia linei TaxID=1819745 RepID=A0A177B6M7_9BILA|nr:hypothetical protein A3Q56_02268 [Intoshia linei]
MNSIDYKKYFFEEKCQNLTFLMKIESDFNFFMNDNDHNKLDYNESLSCSRHIRMLICKLAECWGLKCQNNVECASVTILKCDYCKVLNFCIKDLIEETQKIQVKETNQSKILEIDTIPFDENTNNQNEAKIENSQKNLKEHEVINDKTRFLEEKNKDTKSEANSMDRNEINKGIVIGETSKDEIPNNSIMINPNTLKPFINDDGTIKEYNNRENESTLLHTDESTLNGDTNFCSSEDLQNYYKMQQMPPSLNFYPELLYNSYLDTLLYLIYNALIIAPYVSPLNQYVNDHVVLPPNNIVNENFPVVFKSITTETKKSPDNIIFKNDKQMARNKIIFIKIIAKIKNVE